MHQTLIPHPDSLCDVVTNIAVQALRPVSGCLYLDYVVCGEIGALRLPSVTDPKRADELWQLTCFEAFLRDPSSTSYYEFNFSPSTEWAAYRFDDYRMGIREVSEINAPHIVAQSDDEHLSMHVELRLDFIKDLINADQWHLGVSAIIEEATGQKSYWALAHPPGKADFHHSDGFAHQLGISETS